MFIHLFCFVKASSMKYLSIFGTFRKWVWQLSNAQVRGISIGTFWSFSTVTTGHFSVLTNTFSFSLSQHQLQGFDFGAVIASELWSSLFRFCRTSGKSSFLATKNRN